MKKIACIGAALAAFLMLPIFGAVAYAGSVDAVIEATDNAPAETPPPIAITDILPEEPIVIVRETPPVTDDAIMPAPFVITDIIPEASTTFADDAAPVTDFPETPITDYPEPSPRPFTPSGTGAVVDNATDEDGKEFYTIMTPDEHVFYLVIDKQKETENVYFLNAVTVADLMALAEIPAPPQTGAVTGPQPESTSEPPAEETPSPVEQGQGNSNTGMMIIIAVIAVLGGGAGWYFKIYRPKQQGAASDEEYEPPVADDDNEYPGDWEDEQGEGADDSPAWDGDGSEGEDDE